MCEFHQYKPVAECGKGENRESFVDVVYGWPLGEKVYQSLVANLQAGIGGELIKSPIIAHLPSFILSELSGASASVLA